MEVNWKDDALEVEKKVVTLSSILSDRDTISWVGLNEKGEMEAKSVFGGELTAMSRETLIQDMQRIPSLMQWVLGEYEMCLGLVKSYRLDLDTWAGKKKNELLDVYRATHGGKDPQRGIINDGLAADDEWFRRNKLVIRMEVMLGRLQALQAGLGIKHEMLRSINAAMGRMGLTPPLGGSDRDPLDAADVALKQGLERAESSGSKRAVPLEDPDSA